MPRPRCNTRQDKGGRRGQKGESWALPHHSSVRRPGSFMPAEVSRQLGTEPSVVARILEHKTIEDAVIAVPLRGRDGLAPAVVELGFGGMNCARHTCPSCVYLRRYVEAIERKKRKRRRRDDEETTKRQRQQLLREPSTTSAAPEKVGGPGEQHFSITQAISASTRLYLE